jgi:hypothetical protein
MTVRIFWGAFVNGGVNRLDNMEDDKDVVLEVWFEVGENVIFNDRRNFS